MSPSQALAAQTGSRSSNFGLTSQYASLDWWDILVTMKDILWIISLLEFLKTVKRLGAKRCPHAFNWLIGLHIVDVPTTAERPRLDRPRALARPIDLFNIQGWILPDRQHADVKRGMPETRGCERRVSILGSAVEGFDHDPSRRTSQGRDATEQFIKQFIGKFTH